MNNKAISSGRASSRDLCVRLSLTYKAQVPAGLIPTGSRCIGDSPSQASIYGPPGFSDHALGRDLLESISPCPHAGSPPDLQPD